jgi:hypothetical protein
MAKKNVKGGKGNEPWYKSRRIWSAIVVAISSGSFVFVETGYIPENLYITIGQVVSSVAGVFGVSASWYKPKK